MQMLLASSVESYVHYGVLEGEDPYLVSTASDTQEVLACPLSEGRVRSTEYSTLPTHMALLIT